MIAKTDRSERNWVLGWAIAIVLLASIPYLWGLWVTPPGYQFLGLTHNIDDGAVYLSWMRQSADGHFFIRNLFTNEPQAARAFNVLFLLMGWFAALTHLPLMWVFHLFRVASGIGLILMVWQFSQLFLDKPHERRILIPLVGLSAGVGWLIPGGGAPAGSVDTWQPEAITFLSIYLNPLFLVGLILMLASFHFLVLAQRTGLVRYAVYAGLSMLVLGNVHTYDVLTVACIWTAYLLALWIADRRFPARAVGLSVLAALIAAPSVGYQFYVYSIDPIYRARANTPTPSPAVWSFLLGYGLLLLGAIAGAWILTRRRRAVPSLPSPPSALRSPLFLIVWSVVGFAVPYIPVAQQRKLVMGLHIPLCILCAVALSALLSRLRPDLRKWALVPVILVLGLSNWQFITSDMRLLQEGRTVTHYAPYMRSNQLAAMGYLRTHGTPRDVVLAPPTFALFAPAFTGLQVYYGHWSETPDYADKLRQWLSIGEGSGTLDEALGLLRRTRATYLVGTDEGGFTADLAAAILERPRPFYQGGTAGVYRVRQNPRKKSP